MNRKRVSILAFALLMGVLPIFISSGYIVQSLIMVLLYAYWATTFNIVSGYAGQLSIGHSVYAGLGAYTTAILFANHGVVPWVGMLVGGLIAAVIGGLIAYPCFKLQGSYFTLSTIAMLTVFRLIFLQEDHIFGIKINGALGIKVPWLGEAWLNMQFLDKRYYYYIIFVLLIAVVFISYRISQSKMGYYLAAIRTNQDAASTLGVNVPMFKLRAMVISAFLTAIGGGFYAMLIQFIDPTRMFGYDLSVEIMLYAIVGGIGTVTGPLLGAFILVPINELARSYLGTSYAGLSQVIFGLILMVVIFFKPTGLYDLFKDLLRSRRQAAQPTAES